MADAPADAPADATVRHGVALRAVATILGPLWVTTFRDPLREGRLRLDGLSGASLQAARAGLVGLVLLLASTLCAATWRRGRLLAIVIGPTSQFVPTGVFAATLVGLFLAWVLLTWGALAGSPVIRLLGGAAYLLVNPQFGVATALDLGTDQWVLEHGRALLQVGYFAPAVALALAAATARWPRVDRWVVPATRVVCVLGVAALFLGLLWIHSALAEAGQETLIPGLVGGTLGFLRLLLLPLVYVAALAIIDFALDVSGSLAAPATALTRRWMVLLLVVGLVLVKLWFEVGARTDYWGSTLTHQPQAVLRTVLCLALLAGLVLVVTRFRRSEDTLAAKDDLLFVGALVLSVPFVTKTLLLTLGVLVAAQTGDSRVSDAAGDFPAEWLSSWGILIVAVLAVAGGIGLMWRSEGGLGDELGSGLIVVGAWTAVALALSNSGLTLGFSYRAVDVTVTLAVLVVLLARWRRAEVPFLVVLGTVLLFSWLVTSRGDYLSFLGGLVGLSGVLVVVFGIVWTLVSGSSFASASSRRLPAAGRPLLFLGYLLLSVAILHWDEATHAAASDSDSLLAYNFLGLPLAAWLLGRHITARPGAPADVGSSSEEPQAAAVLR